MRYIRKSLPLLLAAVLVVTVLAPTAFAGGSLLFGEFGSDAYAFVQQLQEVPRFVAAPGGEVAAATMVKGWLSDYGYSPELQHFSFNYRGTKYDSQNVVAYKKASHHGRHGEVPLVVIGAHYDAVPAGKGADDNASGLGTMLEIVGRLAEEDLPYDLAIVAFGSEEAGLIGSDYYVKRMSQADIKRTIVMINFDSLIAGDFRYIHAGFNRKTWARDEMLEIIDRLDLGIITQPGLNKKYPAGLTPNGFSDYTAFNKKGMPIVAFESTNWSVGDLDGYQQTALPPYEFWHTENDVLEIIEGYYPGRPMAHLHAYTELVYTFLSELEP